MLVPLRRLVPALLLTLFCGIALFLFASTYVSASPVEASRPHLELPFPGGTSYEVTCGYGCYQHKHSMEYAVDFAIPDGAPIVAAAAGDVMAVTWELGLPASKNLGDALIVYIDHGEGWFTRYVHLSGITVQVGDRVEQGQIIGYSGKTGASGDHLHFELKHGTSLHSTSVSIDELFGGDEPVAGQSYRSSNRELAAALQGAPSGLLARSTPTGTVPLPTPTPDQVGGIEPALPSVEQAIALSSPSVMVGQPVTVTFTLQNRTHDRLQLGMLGIGIRLPGTGKLLQDNLVFDRSISLNPDRSYTFNRPLQFSEAGEWELFIFALTRENELVPLNGDGQKLLVEVAPPSASLYLPLLPYNSGPLD